MSANLAISPLLIDPKLVQSFCRSLRRLGSEGDPIQAAIHAASDDYGAEGNSDFALWWALYADKGRQGGIRLQWLYVQREAYTDLGRRLFENVSFTEEVQQSDSDIFKAITTLREQVDADIELLESQVRGSRVPAVGVMIATAPPRTCPVYGDPNSSLYRGDPLAGRGRGW